MTQSHTSAAELRKRAKQLQAEADALRDSAQGVISTVRDALQTNLATRPYMTLAAVAGVGYLLGGGLTPRIAQTLAVTGLRMAAGTIANEILMATARPAATTVVSGEE